MFQQLIQNGPVVMAIVGIVVGVGLSMAVVFPMLKKKGVDASTVIQAAAPIINGADQLTDLLKEVFPASGLVNIVDKIVDYAKVGAANAEQLCKINQIERTERKAAAAAYVYEALTLAGYEVSPEVKRIADGALEAAVLALGHGLDGNFDILEGIGIDEPLKSAQVTPPALE